MFLYSYILILLSYYTKGQRVGGVVGILCIITASSDLYHPHNNKALLKTPVSNNSKIWANIRGSLIRSHGYIIYAYMHVC